MAMLSGGWEEALRDEFRQPYYRSLYNAIRKEYETRVIYPPSEDLFQAFALTPLERVKVVILGQDPYHEPGQAHGLCFSVRPGVAIPPSLENIFQELKNDLGLTPPQEGYLEKWARQGVFLLNTVLTVRAHQAASHRGLGWERFTDAAIRVLNRQDRPMVFMLWGRPAGDKARLLNNPEHLVLTAPHPSPLSAYRGFFGCRHFSRCNAFLESRGESPIDWQL